MPAVDPRRGVAAVERQLHLIRRDHVSAFATQDSGAIVHTGGLSFTDWGLGLSASINRYDKRPLIALACIMLIKLRKQLGRSCCIVVAVGREVIL